MGLSAFEEAATDGRLGSKKYLQGIFDSVKRHRVVAQRSAIVQVCVQNAGDAMFSHKCMSEVECSRVPTCTQNFCVLPSPWSTSGPLLILFLACRLGKL
jgi:hypothetical protein